MWLFISFWLVALIIIVGGLTRLTDSGLSITQWQLFTGIFPPLTETSWNHYFDLYKKIPEYQLQNFSMSISEFKIIFWWEYIHRLLGRIIGLFFLLPLIFFTYKIGFLKVKFFYLIFILISFQGFIGWYMVSSGLVDRVDVSHFRLSLHLIIAFIILSLIYWSYLSLNVKSNFKEKINYIFPIIFIILIFFQIAIGAFVSGMDAGKIYNSWPLMGLKYFPDDSLIIDLFSLSVFNNPSLVQFIHRNLAYLIFIFYLYILFKIYKNRLVKLYSITNTVGILLILQIFLGILTLLFGAKIIISSLHQISSIFLVCSSIYFLFINTKFS